VYQLLCQAGGALSYNDTRAAFAIKGLPENLQIAGSVNGQHALGNVIEDGRYAAIKALAALGLGEAPTQAPAADSTRVNFDWPIFAHP
ncbi:hypothetical protein, partial [Klebsiella pneumoniae]